MRANKKKGFSIIGVLVAVFVSSVGMAAVLDLVTGSFSGAQVAKMRLIASGLAQEGIEIIRDDRSGSADEEGWDRWYNIISMSATDYKVEINKTDGSISIITPYVEEPVKFDPDTRLYQYTDGEDTPFYRKIILKKINNDCVEVTAEVKWDFRGNEYKLFVRDNLWNWK